MLSASRFAPCLVALVVVALLATTAAPSAQAQGLVVGLDIVYANDLSSGGTWQVTGRSSDQTFGILSLAVFVSGIDTPVATPIGPRGIVNGDDPAGFSVYGLQTLGDNTYGLILGQAPVGAGSLEPGEEEAVFYGVGRLENGQPGQLGPLFTSLTNVEDVPWATGDIFGDPLVNTAVVLAEGTFSAGLTPNFYSQGANHTSGVVFSSLPATSSAIGAFVAVPATLSVRTIVSDADYNNDGFVNAADFTLWRDTMGQMGFGLAADGVKDGVIDLADYEFWKANFGEPVPGFGSGSGVLPGSGPDSAVPEPASFPLWVGAVLMLVLRRKTRVFRNVRFL